MGDSQLNIAIKARNQAKAEFDKLDKQVKGLQGKSGVGGLNSALGNLDSKLKATTGMSLGFATAAGAAGAAVSGLVKFLTDAVNESVAYATEVDNMSRLLGLSTEETSRLIQASDDLFISQETLTSGLQAATRKGIDVSIDGLKKLADEYNALPEGVTRSKFVLDTFGRSGAEMGKLMEQGAEGIDKATAAIAENMIITERSMQDIMNYKRSVDNLTDSWAGFKYSIGQEVIPQLDLLFRVMTKGKDEVETHAQAVNKLEMQLARAASAAAIGNKSAAQAMIDLQAELDTLNQEFYDSQGAAGTAGTAIETLGTDVSTVTQYFQAMTEQMLFNKLAANMTEQAAMLLASQMGLLDPLTYSVTQRIAELTTKYDINGDGAIDASEATKEYYDEVMALKGAVDSMKSKTISVTVMTNYSEGNIATAEVYAKHDLNGNGIIGKAGGGSVSSRTPYIVGEAGPELFVPGSSGTVIPNNRLAGAGNTVINFYYSPAISLSDRTEAETRLVPIIRKALART